MRKILYLNQCSLKKSDSINVISLNYSQCRLIVSQMSNTRCEILPWILLPVAVAAIFSFMLPSIDLESMYLVSVVALLAHVHYGACVVSLMKYNYALVIIIHEILVCIFL